MRTVQESRTQTIARLETFVSRMERRYECSTATMIDDVEHGRMRETAEIGKWRTSYNVLMSLRTAEEK